MKRITLLCLILLAPLSAQEVSPKDDQAQSEQSKLPPDLVERVVKKQATLEELAQWGLLGVEAAEGRIAGTDWERLQRLAVRGELRRVARTQERVQYRGQFKGFAKMREIAVPELWRLFTDEDETIALRSRAARALSDVQAKEVLDDLPELIDDFLSEEWLVREAEFLAARLGETRYLDQRIALLAKVLEQPLTPANLSTHVAAHEDLAEIYYEISDFSKSVKHTMQKLTILQDLAERSQNQVLRLSLFDEIRGLHYNLGCAYARNRQFPEAISALEIALTSSTISLDMILSDGDLKSLRERPEFQEFLKEARKRSGPAPNPPTSQPQKKEPAS